MTWNRLPATVQDEGLGLSSHRLGKKVNHFDQMLFLPVLAKLVLLLRIIIFDISDHKCWAAPADRIAVYSGTKRLVLPARDRLLWVGSLDDVTMVPLRDVCNIACQHQLQLCLPASATWYTYATRRELCFDRRLRRSGDGKQWMV